MHSVELLLSLNCLGCFCACWCAQSCLPLCGSMDYSLPGSSVYGIFQARILKWVAIYFRGSSQSRDQTHVSWFSYTGRWILYQCTTCEAPYCPLVFLLDQVPVQFSSAQLLSRVRLFATPWTAARQASLVHHQLLEFTQTHVYWVSDAIQPSHPLSSPSPPAFNLSQYQGLFKWVSSSHQVVKIFEFQLQHQSSQWTPRTDLL